MDLTKNRAGSLNLLYGGAIGAGHLQAGAYFHQVHHEMNGDAPDRYPPSPVDITSMGFMPTRERGADFGYRLEFEMPVTARDILRLGSEFHGQTLDDRWPGEPVGMMFDYVNLNHATRNHLGTFVEWQRQVDERLDLLLGARNDTVWMKAGPVQGYDGVDDTAGAFNGAKRSTTDLNLDASLIARYRPNDSLTYDLGLARKSRSPNLYERYAWGTSTIGMISWFGDGNGYTGDPALKAEVAHTVSASVNWHDPQATRWRVNMATYYTRVTHYIGVETLCDPECSGMPAAQLQFANHAARLYGAEGHAEYLVADTEGAGQFRANVALDVVHGQDLSEHTGLYRMMPLNGSLSLAHTLAGWQSQIEVRVVSAKRQVDSLRLEPPTGGYAVADLRTAYSWRSLRVDVAITNLFDRQYADPLGGRWQSGLYPPSFSGAIPGLPGMGRSLDVGITLKL
jgi:iron complex outermembrane receptor protein